MTPGWPRIERICDARRVARLGRSEAGAEERSRRLPPRPVQLFRFYLPSSGRRKRPPVNRAERHSISEVELEAQLNLSGAVPLRIRYHSKGGTVHTRVRARQSVSVKRVESRSPELKVLTLIQVKVL